MTSSRHSQPQPGQVAALVSGGVESCCLVAHLLGRGRTVWPVYVRGGLRWEASELRSVRRWLLTLGAPRLRPLSVVEAPARALYGRHWSVTGRGVPGAASSDAAVYLPGRNVLLLGSAAIYAAQRGVSRLAVGTLAGNPFGDASRGFFSRFSRCLGEALAVPMQIEAPFHQMTKSQVIAAHAALPFHLTWSCLRPAGPRQCGRCNKCAERRRAFQRARVPDPTVYAR